LLHDLDYSLQSNQKTLEGSQHADRDEQFEYINRKAQRYLKQCEPVISVDTKKRNWWVISRMRDESSMPKVSPSKFAFTISRFASRTKVKWRPMESTTWDVTSAV
jgi:DDE family transposase